MSPDPIPCCNATRGEDDSIPFFVKADSHHRENDSNRLRRGSSATATSEATTELGLELSGSTALTLLAGITATVSLTVTATLATTATTAAATALTVVTAEHATWGSVGALLLDVRLGHNLGREVEPLAEVVKTLGGEGVVVVLP